jgi:hypothetical protein
MHPFNETQRFDQWWIKAVLAIPLFETLAFILNDYQSTGEVQNKSLIGLAIVVAVIILLWMMKLTTRVDETGIQYSFFPFHLKPKMLTWEEIGTAYMRNYKPLTEYGGWGIRISSNGKAFNVKGKRGLQLTLKNGKKILIGTSDNQRLDTYLRDIRKQYAISAIQ